MQGGKRDPGLHPLSVIPAGAQREPGPRPAGVSADPGSYQG